MEVLIVLLIVGAVALVIAGAVYHHKKEKERRESLRGLAAELGWSFSHHDDRSHDDLYAHFELFRRGHGRAAYNTLSGPLEIKGRQYDAKAGDFTYKVTSGTGKSRRTTTYHFSYLIVHLPFGQVPALIIRREGMFDRVAGFFGYGSISFESAKFNRRFFVNGDDKKFAYDVLHPRMMEFLMETEPPTIDIEYGRMCLSDGRRRWSRDEFRRQIDWMQRFFGNWPKHVKADLEARASHHG